ncbi:DUF2922 domain-containing protein [Fodinisporobacter ferrooxydans]|uniref:DUF2922 domain-containing protein n=1 Tax=Fodinisporobacter ferrooxydans TaxID=2901836 RepID=A0ABY4CW93_9BACL|nr:DUF2922 domain-containing protein [Alicyclobacillaceae bacterium MYW30-H2]
MTKTTLELIFQTASGQKVRIQIPNPKQPVDPVSLNAALDLIVSKNCFVFKSGDIVKKIGAQISSSTQTPVSLT